MSQHIIEFVDSGQAKLRIDSQASVIYGVKILGLESKNNRRYSPQALGQAIPLYEGARVNVNHPQGRADAPRAYQDRIGTVRNVRLQDDGLYGDFHFNPKHPVAEQLAWDAQHAPENVGFSHNALARTSVKQGQTLVEEIVAVRSVDLVADPATTRGLFEQQEPAGTAQPRMWDNRTRRWVPLDSHVSEEKKRPLDLNLLRRDHPELYEQIRAEAERELQQVTADETRALEHAARERQERLAATLLEARLPPALRSERFENLCRSAPDEETFAALIQLRQEDCQWFAANRKPVSVEQTNAFATGPTVHDGASFAAALR
ncbi:MAG: hypothetical protein KDA42_09550 [Planctomycetales bacterium]|nr:hypothetical protein [Planctomycetales bacterium]